jgi:unsaturated rhamnogalacturonyl hydrolase
VLSQLVDMDGDLAPDQLVFQVDLAANASKTVKLRVGERPTAVAADYKAYGRFVRERYDDFAWENDWVAHRMYGPALETSKNDPLTSSGIDVWVKRVRRLVVNEWYMTDNYHQDHGDGLDAYKVGPSRGCGGTGIWTGKKLAVSKNFKSSRVLANGPIRLVFELSYAPWAAGPARVSETKRVILDAGSLFNHFTSTFSGRAPVSLGIGIAKHPGGVVEFDAQSAWMRDWEPLDEGKAGNVGCAIVLAPGATAAQQQTASDYLVVVPAKGGVPAEYYVGTAWDRGGRVVDVAGWKREVERLSRRLAAPVQVNLAAMPAR